ncbi:MAG: hypothetical protein ACR2GK_01930 [Gemmatimonadaceae bacterium]
MNLVRMRRPLVVLATSANKNDADRASPRLLLYTYDRPLAGERPPPPFAALSVEHPWYIGVIEL